MELAAGITVGATLGTIVRSSVSNENRIAYRVN